MNTEQVIYKINKVSGDVVAHCVVTITKTDQ